MAIKLPDPGNGIPEQKTGNDEWTNMKIVRDNFAGNSNAASRIVGTETGNVMEVGAFGIGRPTNIQGVDSIDNRNGMFTLPQGVPAQGVAAGWLYGITWTNASTLLNKQIFFGAYDSQLKIRQKITLGGAYSEWATFYSTANTTKDVATGFLKASSPVLHVYNDKITKIHEAEQLDITVGKKGVGHYEIHGTTGLRKNDGWYMSPPRDLHGNVLCMIDVTEKDGVVILKTYKKKFDFETVAIVHDYDNPMNIPDGACVEFRFNDLPEEQLDEPTI